MFLDYADLQRRRRNWDIVRSLTEAKALAPETFGHVHKDTPRKWKRPPPQAPETRGRHQALSPAALTILSEVVDKVSSAVTVAAPVYRELFKMELERAGMKFDLSLSWTQHFLRTCNKSYKKRVLVSKPDRSDDVKASPEEILRNPETNR